MNLRNVFNSSVFVLAAALGTSCQPDGKEPVSIIKTVHENDSAFPKVADLSAFRNTEFIPTLEHKTLRSKNTIYVASVLYGWNDLVAKLDGPVIVDKENNDLWLLNNSTSFRNALKRGEYASTVTVQDLRIEVKTSFSKALPFEVPMLNLPGKLKFGKIPVEAFGVESHLPMISAIIHILYYENDSNFIVQLDCKDTAQEVILCRTTTSFETMADLLKQMQRNAVKGEEESKMEFKIWRYVMNDDDELIIPKLRFNIKHRYTALENKLVKTKSDNFLVTEVSQHTSFVLNEKGTEMEEELLFALEAAMMPEGYEEPKPKKMRFDKSFFVMLKRKDSVNPYFGMWVADTELMTRE